ncbi:MAG TPA: cysteine peptidase family C39 domain-containing protein, partial [Stenomitos sp.]
MNANTSQSSLPAIPWDALPLALLNPEQLVQIQNQAQTRRYTLGEKIWSTDSPGELFLVVAGKVRLREEGATKPLATLGVGDWFGDWLQLSGAFKAVASGKEVVVVCWDTALWQEVLSPDIERFWHQTLSRLVPPTVDSPQPVSGYPFVSSLNTAAACLTMVTQQLQNPAQLDWVQRQLRGQQPKHLVEAGEKLGLQLRRLQTTWSDLQQLTFPALMRWNQGTGDRGREAQGREITPPLSPSHWVM